MHRPALIAFTIVVLAGCSQGSDTDASAPTAPARPAPTAAEKAALLASLPAPWNAADLENGRRAFARCRSSRRRSGVSPDVCVSTTEDRGTMAPDPVPT